MKKTFELFENTPYKNIYENLVKQEDYNDLLGTLVMMQTDRGVKLEDAKKNAEQTVISVCACESVRFQMEQNAEAVVDKLLEDIKKQDNCERLLHKFYFGLTANQQVDAETVIEGDFNVDTMFWNYYSKNKGKKTVEQLEADIRQALANYELSAEVLKALAKKCAVSDEYLATANALREGGMNLKCISAMELYLDSNGQLTVPEAANLACGAVQMQAVSDAVGKGKMTRKTAKKILIIAGITLVVVGIVVAIWYGGGAAAMAKASAAAVDFWVPMPEVFAEFGSTMMVRSAASVRKMYAPLIEAAAKKAGIGGIILAIGVAALGISKKAAHQLGKLRVGLVEKNSSCKVAEGLADVAAQVEQDAREETKQQVKKASAAATLFEELEEEVYESHKQKEKQSLGAV